jgi:hypothetical protein
MAAYHKVEVSLNTNAVEVGIPSPQTVNVTLPTIGPAGPTGSVGPAGPTGPQGVPGTGLEVLTVQGDLLYQGASTGQRLAIGTAGQILKVNAGATAPEWGAAPASGVSSVNGATGAVTIGAFSYGGGGSGLVPQATGGDAGRFLKGDASWSLPTTSDVQGLSDALAAKQNTGDYVTPTRIETDYFDRGGDNAATRPGTGGQKRYQVVLSNDTRLIDQRSIAWITPAPSSPTDNTTNPALGSVSYDGNYLYVLVQTPGSQSRRWGRVPMPLNWT